MLQLWILALTGLVSSVSAINVPVSTKYLTTEVTTLAESTDITLIGFLCGQAKGNTVNVTVVLNNNPLWILDIGVLYFYVVDSPNKTSKDALCSNTIGGKVGPTCSVKSWPSAGDLYVIGRSGPVEAVSFTLDAEIQYKTVEDRQEPQHKHQSKPELHDTLVFKRKLQISKVVYLTEYITLEAASVLPRLSEAHLNFSFCPTPDIGSQYVITSTVIGTDGESSYTLYICNKYPCNLTYPDNIVAHNGRQLPSNTVATTQGQWRQMYALIVCWGGPYDPVKKQFIGRFQFNSIASKK